MSVLEGLSSAWLRQRPPALRAAAWAFAVAGPALLTAGALGLHSALLQGGSMFASLVLIFAIAVVGGMRPALMALAITVLLRVVFLAPPFTSGSDGAIPNLLCFVVGGLAVSVLIAR